MTKFAIIPSFGGMAPYALIFEILRQQQGERIVKSPLQRTLTAHIMSRWAKHEGALAHISLQQSVEMLVLQCA